jgi:NAD+ kinase
MYYHNLHKTVEKQVAESFKKVGVEIQIVNRVTISIEKLKWADMVVPVGGDGTFLLAAGRASHFFVDKHMPVVGFNSDPKRSEGRLMLPKQYTHNIDDAVKKILIGDYKFMQRSRIRITLLGANCNAPRPIDLHEYNVAPVEHKEVFVPGPKFLNLMNGCSHRKDLKRMLPYLALNEVSLFSRHPRVSDLLNFFLFHNKTISCFLKLIT